MPTRDALRPEKREVHPEVRMMRVSSSSVLPIGGGRDGDGGDGVSGESGVSAPPLLNRDDGFVAAANAVTVGATEVT